MALRMVNRRYRQLRRYRQIAEVFLRHGFGLLVEQLELHHLIPLRRRVMAEEDARSKTRGARLRQALQELGPTFVKLGQVLSTRPDVVPPDIVAELANLQDAVPSAPFPEIRASVEEELGKPLHDLFQSFEEEPVAAGSIGQVHRAVLKDGHRVAVKVRRPGIAPIIEADLEILYSLARIIEERLQPEFIRPRELVHQFARTLRVEMDYELEAHYMDRFRRLFASWPKVKIPRVFWDLTTPKVLTMEYVQGVKINDVEALDRLGVDRRQLASLGARAFLQQVLMEGIFHGDPHPGNLFVEEDGTLVLLDFGMVGRIDEEMMGHLADLFVGIIGRDVNRVVQGLMRIGAVEGSVDRRALMRDMEELIDRHYGKPLHRLHVGQIVAESFELTVRHRIRMPEDFVLLGKALLTMESTGKLLDPDFNVAAIAEPFARDLLARRWSPDALAQRLRRDAVEYGEVLIDLPRRAERVLLQAETGNLQIQFRHQGLEKLIHRLDVASNRLAAGVIIAALIVGSSLIIQADRGPFLWGFPLVGLVGFAVAGLIGFWLILSILRSGRI